MPLHFRVLIKSLYQPWFLPDDLKYEYDPIIILSGLHFQADNMAPRAHCSELALQGTCHCYNKDSKAVKRGNVYTCAVRGKGL